MVKTWTKAVAVLLAIAASAWTGAHAGTIATIAGTGNTGFGADGGLATATSIYSPVMVAVDPAGNVYIADTYNQRIRKVDTSGIITTVAGTGVSGYNGDGIAATAAQLNYPQGIALDDTGNLYIADTYNHRVRRVSTVGTITTVAGTGSPGYGGDGGLAVLATLNSPSSVLWRTNDSTLFVADNANQRVRRVTGGVILNFAGTGVGGFSGDGGAATAAQLLSPISLALDSSGRLHITDFGNSRIRRVELSGMISTVAGDPDSAQDGDGAQATATRMNNPRGLAIAPSGVMYIVHSHMIRHIAADGRVATLAGSTADGFGGDGGPAANAVFFLPSGMALDATGNLYVVDSQNNRVRKITDPSIYAVTVLRGGDGTGTVTSTPTGIVCGSDCVGSHPGQTVVTLLAVPAAGSTFANWQLATCVEGSFTPLCTLPALVANTTARAMFAAIPRTFTATIAGPPGYAIQSSHGTCASGTCSGVVPNGTVVTLTGLPSAFAAFRLWSGVTCNEGQASAVCTFAVTSNITALASFGYEAVVTKVGSGTVTSNPAGINCDVACTSATVIVPPSTNVTLTATPAAGWKFQGWSQGNPVPVCESVGSAPCTMQPPQSVRATFVLLDTVPDAFAFSAATNIALNTQVTSSAATITGINAPTPISVTAGSYSIGCNATFVTAAGTISSGQTVCVRHTSSHSGATPTTTTLDIGGVTASFTSTTVAVNTNPPRLANISTRGQVMTGGDVMIAGFIIGGATAKTVVVSVAGPSLVAAGIPNALANPTLTLVRSSDGVVVGSNDDWQAAANAAAIQSAGFAPAHALEPAVMMALAPGAYTAIVQGVGGGTGVGLVGVYEVDHPEVPLINISTRGQVMTGNDVMIAGLIIQGDNTQQVVITVAGPSLLNAGIANALANPVLTIVRASDGAVIATNDNWQTQTNPAHVAAIQNAGFAPAHVLEPAVFLTLPPGAYTAIVQGSGSTGVGLVGVYKVN